jgi:hypothetical protein
MATSEPAYTPRHEKICPPEYLRGIDLFNAGDYFECHEVLEDIWMVSSGQEKLFYQGMVRHGPNDVPEGQRAIDAAPGSVHVARCTCVHAATR